MRVTRAPVAPRSVAVAEGVRVVLPAEAAVLLRHRAADHNVRAHGAGLGDGKTGAEGDRATAPNGQGVCDRAARDDGAIDLEAPIDFPLSSGSPSRVTMMSMKVTLSLVSAMMHSCR